MSLCVALRRRSLLSRLRKAGTPHGPQQTPSPQTKDPLCWEEEAGISFQSCCTFEFGPELLGLFFFLLGGGAGLILRVKGGRGGWHVLAY